MPNAFEHRGVQVHKMTMDLGVPNPLTPTGAMESYYAVAGNYSLTTSYSDAGGMKALIDSVLDNKVKLHPMPGNTLATFSMQFAGFLNMMGGGLPMGDMPESMNMDLSKSNGQVLIKMDMK